MPAAKNVLRTVAITLALAGLIVVGGIFYLNRTVPGQRIVVGFALTQLESAIEGTIDFDSIRSSGILGGATLYGVEVKGFDQRPFLRVDSVATSYRWQTFLTGDVVLSSLLLYGAHMTISRYPGEERFNADRIFRPDSLRAPGDSTRTVRLDGVRLVDASVEILEAVDAADPPPERMNTVTLPGSDVPMQRIYFEDIQAWMSSVVVAAPGLLGPEVSLDSLSLVGHVYEDPFRLTQLDGQVSWAEGKLVIVADEISLPDTRADGRIVADFTEEGRGGRDTGWTVELQLNSPRYALRDLRWLQPTLPAHGTGRGRFDIRLTDVGEVQLGFSDARLALGEGRLAGAGSLTRSARGSMTLRDVRLEASSLPISELERFTGELPLEGSLQGQVTLHGPLESLQMEGRVTLVEPGYDVSSADFTGTFHWDERGVSDLVAAFDPLDLSLLTVFVPENKLGGTGHGRITATGNLAEGVTFQADLTHLPGRGLPSSRVDASGTVRKSEEDVILDVDADVSPLSLTALSAYFPSLPFSGEVTGNIRATGPLGDLSLRTNLETEAGLLALDARFDARDPGAYYRLEGELGEFALSRLVEGLPEPTVVSGTLRLEGRGDDLRTATIDASLNARASRIWELDVDSARLALRARGGVLYVDTATAVGSGVTLIAGGTLAAYEDGPPGEIRVILESDSLETLRPVLMGRDLRVRDNLTELERETLRAQGIDPDTLPTAEEVALSGRAEGSATLRGSLERFSVEGTASLDEVRYGTRSLNRARVTFSADGLPDQRDSWSARVEADSLTYAGLGFRGADLVVSYQQSAGNAEIFLERNERENYRAIARFQLDSLGGRVDLDALALRMDSVTWNLERPASVAWDSTALRVAGLALIQAEDAGARIEVDGVLPKDGQVDLSVDVQGLRLEHVSRMLQRERNELSGLAHLDVTIRGQAERPLIIGSLSATDVRYQDYGLDLVQGQIAYRERRLDVDLEAREGDLRVLRATGFIPAAVDLREPSFDLPDEPIDLQVVADSLPAAFATALFPALVDVQGTVAGDFDIGGTLDNPEPSGQLVLQNAAWTIEALGVRHDNVRGTLTLRPDATMEVDAIAYADGDAYVSGEVILAPLRNPEFNLTISFNGFRAVERRDVDGHVSGVISLTGPFNRPVVRGLTDEGRGLYVDRGVLYVEEAVRSATVVDLSDPRFANFVDLSILESSILEESTNPFLQNLFVNVDLVVEQNTWLRSSEMQVEIAGNLAVQYDRSRMLLVLVGELQALRGPYTVFGRRFDVQQGTIEFIGIAGVDPNLDIVARTRVRREGDPLDITARVTGTLTQPSVTLSSEEAAVSQSDLVSYLLFGMPSYELASGQTALLNNTAGSFLGAGLGAGLNVFRSAVTTRLGAVLAQQWGLDYFAITEAGNLGGWDVGGLDQTQVEIGQYLGQDIFMAVAFQPVQAVGGSNPFLSTFGLRLEYTPTDAYTVQAFWEDRFFRQRIIGFQDAAFRSQKVLGLSIFTEWGF